MHRPHGNHHANNRNGCRKQIAQTKPFYIEKGGMSHKMTYRLFYFMIFQNSNPTNSLIIRRTNCKKVG